MNFENRLYPDEEQMRGFADPGAEGPIYMLNLLKYRDRASYEDGRETDLTGREAYGIYAAGVSELLRAVGGAPIFFANVERLMIGQVDELWDDVAIAVYPSRVKMLEMMQMPGMADIGVHRAAGLEGQLNIELVGAQGGLLDVSS